MATRPNNKSFDLAIIGAGPAGLLAAIAAAENNHSVIILEQMKTPAMKLIASGGGRGNITNTHSIDHIQKSFGRQGRFMNNALQLLPPESLRELFHKIGIPTVAEPNSRVYPKSNRAITVQIALLKHLEKLNVQIRNNSTVDKLIIQNNQLAGLQTQNNKTINANKILLATGGKSFPSLGGSHTGYRLAKQAGHSITDPTPGLVPLVTTQKWTAQISGVSLDNIRITIPLPKQPKAGTIGDILFTHKGLSGPAIMDLSANIATLLQKHNTVPITLELVKDMTPQKWSSQIDHWRSNNGNQNILTLLKQNLTTSICQCILNLCNIDEKTPAAQISASDRQSLANNLGKLTLNIKSTENFDAAYVTRGGVKLKEVDPTNLQSKILPNLHFAGEILDLDGPTGGFNLTWAFASGYLVGHNI